MSSESFPRIRGPAEWLEELRSRLVTCQERRLVRVQGSQVFTHQWAAAAVASLELGRSLWVGEERGEVLTMFSAVTPPAKARQFLGLEFDVVVWDVRAGLHPDGFGAIVGTIHGGGALVLLTPEDGYWHQLDDPDYRRMGSRPADKRFLGRLERVLREAPSVISVTAGQPLPAIPFLATAEVRQALPTADQREAIAAIKKVRRGHRRRPLVITADRGRGKSAALGIAAAQLLEQEDLTIIVTAPRPAALGAFWRHAAEIMPDATQQPAELKRGQASIRYEPPAELLESFPEADLLLVDEAAAIPVPVLRKLLEHYARVVFASTVHGYEGSGRGFALRFHDHLNAVTPGWQALTLAQPVRWAKADPLEPLLNRLLLLDADLGELNDGKAGGITIVPWPRAERTEDERRLAEVFGLLVNAHYQTTPDDLRLLLDGVDGYCWLALESGKVVGAVWAQAEGSLAEPLAEAVRRGERRTRGHLLPQALAAYGGDTEAAMLSYWRLVRIAVHPRRRRRGLGQRLIAVVAEGAKTAAVDVFGTSFGASPDLIGFWQECGMRSLRLGLRSDAASGAPSMMLGQGLTPAGEAMCARQRRRFAEHWPTLLMTDLQGLEPALVWQLSPQWCPNTGWSAQDALEVGDFADGFRPLALTRLALQRLTWHSLPGLAGRLAEILAEDSRLWCRAILQQIPESNWQAEGLAKGRKDGNQRLQRTAARLLATAGEAQQANGSVQTSRRG